jgi:hypothetical protein
MRDLSRWQSRSANRKENEMAQDIVGSKMPEFPTSGTPSAGASTKGYGENGYQGPSSLSPGEARRVSKQLADLSKPDAALADIAASGVHCDQSALNWQQRPQSAKPGKPTANMKRQQTGTIGKLPSSLGYGPAVAPSVKPAKLGIFKR